MDSALALVLNLQKLSLYSPAAQSALATARPEDIVADTLGRLLAEHELQQAQNIFRQIGSSAISAAAAFQFTGGLARAIREKEKQSHQIAASSMINRVLEDILMLRFIADSQVIDYIDFRPKNIELFHYISKLDVEPAPGEPAVVLVGTLPRSIVKHDITASLKNDSYIERKTEIIYRGAPPYPRLNLKLPFRCGSRDIKKVPRFEWIQRHSQEHDLEVYTFQERLIGSIQTRDIELPYTIEGKKFSITIPKQEDTLLLETSILDQRRNPLTRYIRVAVAEK